MEDPFLWIDTNGVFKAFWHVYNTHQDRSECVNSTVSAYAYSLDGFTWTASPIQPYSTQVGSPSAAPVPSSCAHLRSRSCTRHPAPSHLPPSPTYVPY